MFNQLVRSNLRYFVLGLSLSCAAFTSLSGQLFAEDLTIVDASKGGVDFEIQGEYLGVVEADSGRTWGAQVIALGDGKFHSVGFSGGLPGDGYDASQPLREGDAKLEGNVAKISGDEFQVVIDGKTLQIKDLDGNPVATLKKVHRESPTLGAKPPEGAIVLFDGKDASQWENGKVSSDGLLGVNVATKKKFNDFALHLEFRTPFMPNSRGQARGNSGLYIQSRYECQILDSFGLSGENNECGGIYQIAKPKVNMCYPPLSWQTYDVDFTAARYDASGKKTENAKATIRHNGVVIHQDLVFPRGTPGREGEANSPAGIYLQDHGNPVAFRNIWIVEKTK